MKHPLRSVTAALGLLVAAAAALAAHDLFIKMDRYRLPPDTPVRIPIINGTFQVSENSITADRVADVSVLVEGRRRHLGTDGWNAKGDTTYLEFRTGEPGTYVLGVETLPRELSLPAADFNQYLAGDGVLDVLKQRALERELDRDARERYAKHVKAVFQVGEELSGGIDVPLGHPAELLPLDNPYQATVGDVLAFRALVDGAPVAGQLVLAGGDGGAEGVIEEREARSDDDGVVRFRMDQAGRWYVKFIHMSKVEDGNVNYESQWATLTFEIR
ncbi:MAG: DUF4198 domain-containing protein [Gemmatimonadota bacterium]